MPDPVPLSEPVVSPPVQLAAVEKRKDGPPGSESWQLVNLTLRERDAVCSALRLAREGLAKLSDGLGPVSPNALEDPAIAATVVEQAWQISSSALAALDARIDFGGPS